MIGSRKLCPSILSMKVLHSHARPCLILRMMSLTCLLASFLYFFSPFFFFCLHTRKHVLSVLIRQVRRRSIASPLVLPRLPDPIGPFRHHIFTFSPQYSPSRASLPNFSRSLRIRGVTHTLPCGSLDCVRRAETVLTGETGQLFVFDCRRLATILVFFLILLILLLVACGYRVGRRCRWYYVLVNSSHYTHYTVVVRKEAE